MEYCVAIKTYSIETCIVIYINLIYIMFYKHLEYYEFMDIAGSTYIYKDISSELLDYGSFSLL